MNIEIMLSLLYKLNRLRQHESWSRAQLAAYQTASLRRLREYAYGRSPFYQRFHKGLYDRPLNDLPVLTKSIMMENFDTLVTDRSLRLEDVRAYSAGGKAGQPYRDQYWVNATSGSSGHPGFFLFDRAEWLSILASFARSQEWSGVKIDLTHRQRMATVASISPWHMSAQVAATVESWWRPSLRLPASQPLDETIRQLNLWQPEVLIAYASMTRILADEQLGGRLRIHPQVVYSASEVLTAGTRHRAREAWGDEPFDQYVATETASIAAEHRGCRHMHFFEDLLIVEVVDEHHKPVPSGELGAKVLVTTLFSRTQPLIRYEINDSVRLRSGTHNCGLPFSVMDGVMGRSEDALRLPAEGGGMVTIQPLVFNRILDVAPVRGWQIMQAGDGHLTLLLAGAGEGLMDAMLLNSIQQALRQQGAQVPRIELQRVAGIPKNASGKAPLIKAYSPINPSRVH